jgi:O-antigen ligase
MQRLETEKLVARLMAFTLSTVTIVVFTQSVTDPVNVTKLFFLGALAFATAGAALKTFNSQFIKLNGLPLVLLVSFFVFSISTLIASNAPLTQSLYGVYGRNNGFLLYLLLGLLFISTLTITSQSLFRKYLFALAIAGVVNVLYALWVMAFGDFIGWNNPYGNLLGTLGNPNFIGSFFGMFAALLFTQVASKTESRKLRVGALILLPFVFLGIIDSHAVQGKVLFVAGAGIVIFYWVRDRFISKWFSITYLVLAFSSFIIALLGTLQKGPLAGVLYKETVSLRGEYWHAGWQTGSANPIFGAGFDSYGDWYRRSRRESALTLPGVDTVTNTAHNVFLDIFAFGGWPLFMSYILLVLLVVASILKFTIRNKKFDPIFVALTSVWACYQLQSTISINQIGLAIWGWAFGAAIIAYEMNDARNRAHSQLAASSSSTSKRKMKNSQPSVVTPGLTAGLAAVVGMLVAVPPLSADMKWRTAQESQDANRVEAVLTPSYLNPLNAFAFNNIVGVFETNNLTDLAYKHGIEAVKFNPDSFEAWRNLSQLSRASEADRQAAFANMKRLDPLNMTIGAAK